MGFSEERSRSKGPPLGPRMSLTKSATIISLILPPRLYGYMASNNWTYIELLIMRMTYRFSKFKKSIIEFVWIA